MPVFVTSHFWMSRSHTILGNASNVSVTLHHSHGFQPVSRAGMLHPLELQRLAHLDCYFNLLQLLYSFFLWGIIRVTVWVFINHRCVQTLASWTLQIYCIYVLMTRACRTVHISKDWCYQRSLTSFKKHQSCSNCSYHPVWSKYNPQWTKKLQRTFLFLKYKYTETPVKD